jgi:hypothetical protein
MGGRTQPDDLRAKFDRVAVSIPSEMVQGDNDGQGRLPLDD